MEEDICPNGGFCTTNCPRRMDGSCALTRTKLLIYTVVVDVLAKRVYSENYMNALVFVSGPERGRAKVAVSCGRDGCHNYLYMSELQYVDFSRSFFKKYRKIAIPCCSKTCQDTLLTRLKDEIDFSDPRFNPDACIPTSTD